jgi:hypothetical protein
MQQSENPKKVLNNTTGGIYEFGGFIEQCNISELMQYDLWGGILCNRMGIPLSKQFNKAADRALFESWKESLLGRAQPYINPKFIDHKK